MLPHAITPSACADLYLTFRDAEGLTRKTLSGYRDALNLFLTAVPDVADVRELAPVHAARFLAGLRARGLSDGGISVHQRATWTWFRWLHEQGYVSQDISRLVKRVRVRDPKRRTASMDARERMLAVALAAREHKYRNAAIVEFLWGTGARVDEVSRIMLADLDLEAGTVIITGKGGKRRISGVNAQSRVRLHEYIVRERGLQAGTLFLGRSQRDITRNALRLTVQALAKRAGVTASSHDFRRACASRLLAEGVPAEDVARQLGHSLQMTLMYGEQGRTERALSAYHAADNGVRPLRRKSG